MKGYRYFLLLALPVLALYGATRRPDPSRECQ